MPSQKQQSQMVKAQLPRIFDQLEKLPLVTRAQQK
jgi:hypothetical protein